MDSNEVLKREYDQRQYRVIRLDNGLTALLASTLPDESPNPSSTALDLDDAKQESGSEDADDGSEELDDMSHDGSVKNIGEKSASQTNKEVSFLQRSDSEELNGLTNSAALCVGVGSMHDPDDIPGLAHLLEHMVFMGSEKYPGENDFDMFIKSHGGTSNANTGYEFTRFQIEIQAKYFRSALDRFAQFFIHPLMKANALENEAKIVHAEWAMALQKDRSRYEQLFLSLTKPGHPMNKFMWGNIETLIINPAKNNIDVHAALQEFRKKHYVAQHMTLAIEASEDLDTLEQWVRASFSAIPSSQDPRFDFGTLGDPFDSPEFRRLYKVIPVRNLHEVEMTWSLPSLVKEYRHWIRQISAGVNDTIDAETNSAYSSFKVILTLTEEGLANFEKAITVVFQYLKMLQDVGPRRDIWEEINRLEDSVSKRPEEAHDFVDSLAFGMQKFQTRDFVIGGEIPMEYDDRLISDCLNRLQPDRMNIIVYSKLFKNVCNLREKWFRTPYSVEDIPTDWLEQWKNPPPMSNNELHLPDHNIYIATETEYIPAETEYAEIRDLTDTKVSRLWYKNSEEFPTHVGYVHFYLWSKHASRTPTQMCMTDMLVEIIRMTVMEELYPAELAGYSHNIGVFGSGIALQVVGDSQKLMMVFKTYINNISRCQLTEKLFNEVRKELDDSYRNTVICPQQLNREVCQSLLNYFSWSALQKRTSMSVITLDMLTDFIDSFSDGMFVEGLVMGNLTSRDALEMEKFVIEKLDVKPIMSADDYTKTVITELATGTSVHIVPNFNERDPNCVITNYYQFGVATVRQQVLNELLVTYMDEPCFAELRTKKQAGYDAFVSNRNFFGILGFSITISSQSTKFTMKQLDTLIEDFLVNFSRNVKEMKSEEFDSLMSSVMATKDIDFDSISDEVNRYWSEIMYRQHQFDRAALELDELQTITFKEFKDWCETVVPPSPKRKKLTLQVTRRVLHLQKNGKERKLPMAK